MTTHRDAVVAVEEVAQRIVLVRGQRVILDAELAALYGVTTKRFNEQVRRNLARFPRDFMFQLTASEYAAIRSQIATFKSGRGQHRKYLPYAFTEHGAIMAATVLNSSRAIEVSVYVVRAFLQLRDLLSHNRAFALKLNELERKLVGHDQAITGLISAMRKLMAAPEAKPKRPIGFVTPKE